MAEGGRKAGARGTGATGAPFGGVYLITIIGAAVYFIGTADGFWEGVLGLLKALVWPAFVVYRALELLNL
jgi:hypothetical protein